MIAMSEEREVKYFVVFDAVLICGHKISKVKRTVTETKTPTAAGALATSTKYRQRFRYRILSALTCQSGSWLMANGELKPNFIPKILHQSLFHRPRKGHRHQHHW